MLRRTWASIEEQARKIKSVGVVKRFLTSDADAKKLEGLVAEMSSSIHDDFLVNILHNIPLSPYSDPLSAGANSGNH